MTGDNISRCDWYSATVNAPTDGLISGFLHHFDAVPRETVAHNSYKRAVEVVRGESRIATISWGGVNLRPSVVSSGAASQEVMVYLRSLSSPHSVSRMDAAIDFVGTFVFSQITEMIIKILEEHKFRGVVPGISQVGDWIHGQARTLYVGSRNSRTFLRIYEKTAERLAAGDHNVPENWVRAELEYKPTNAAEKQRASRLSPDDCWRASAWTRIVFSELCDSDLPMQLPVPIRRPSTRFRAISAMIRQYSNTLDSVRHDIGDTEFSSWMISLLDAATSDEFEEVLRVYC